MQGARADSKSLGGGGKAGSWELGIWIAEVGARAVLLELGAAVFPRRAKAFPQRNTSRSGSNGSSSHARTWMAKGSGGRGGELSYGQDLPISTRIQPQAHDLMMLLCRCPGECGCCLRKNKRLKRKELGLGPRLPTGSIEQREQHTHHSSGAQSSQRDDERKA